MEQLDLALTKCNQRQKEREAYTARVDTTDERIIEATLLNAYYLRQVYEVLETIAVILQDRRG